MELIRLLEKLNNDVGFTIVFSSRNTSQGHTDNNNIFHVSTTTPTEAADRSGEHVTVDDQRDNGKTSRASNDGVIMTNGVRCKYLPPITLFNNHRQTKPHIRWISTSRNTDKRTVVEKVPKRRYGRSSVSERESNTKQRPSQDGTPSNQYEKYRDESQRGNETNMNYVTRSAAIGTAVDEYPLTNVLNTLSENTRTKPSANIGTTHSDIDIGTDPLSVLDVDIPSSDRVTFKLPDRLNNYKIQSMEYGHATRSNIRPEDII